MSAEEQREAFEAAMTEALGGACSLEVVRAVHEQLSAKIEEHKESKDPEPLTISAGDVSMILQDCGIPVEQAEIFQKCCGERFGEGAVLNPVNLIDAKKVELKTGKVSIFVDPEYSYLLETKVVDGQKVLLIPVENELEFNGLPVGVSAESSEE